MQITYLKIEKFPRPCDTEIVWVGIRKHAMHLLTSCVRRGASIGLCRVKNPHNSKEKKKQPKCKKVRADNPERSQMQRHSSSLALFTPWKSNPRCSSNQLSRKAKQPLPQQLKSPTMVNNGQQAELNTFDWQWRKACFIKIEAIRTVLLFE